MYIELRFQYSKFDFRLAYFQVYNIVFFYKNFKYAIL